MENILLYIYHHVSISTVCVIFGLFVFMHKIQGPCSNMSVLVRGCLYICLYIYMCVFVKTRNRVFLCM